MGRITVETAAETWRNFQLRGGDGQSWLRVPIASDGTFYWLKRITTEGDAGDSTTTIDGNSFTLSGSVEGSAEIIGSGGSSDDRSVTVYTYLPAAGNNILSVYHWRADEISLLGEPIDAADLELWSREGGKAI